jgi:hypothetical protein
MKNPRDADKALAPSDKHADSTAQDPRAKDLPMRERRATHRVDDDQQSGQGSASALSKLKMQERKRAAIRPRHDDN